MNTAVRSFLTTLAAGLIVLTFVAAKQRSVGHPQAPIGPGPTFNKEIVRLFQQHCQSCHHDGDVAPFPLVTYADARAHALQIKFMTQSHQMPPWKPTPNCGDFTEQDSRTLTSEEIALIARWVDSGAPEGNPTDLPPPTDFSSGWTAGQPDMVVKMPEPFTPPSDRDEYRCFSIPTNLTSDKYVSAIDVHPGDRKTVHHVIAYLDTTGASQRLDEKEAGPGYQCFGGPGFQITSLTAATLGGWAPGARPVMLPEDVAMLLPAASRIVLQVHYHSHDGHPTADQTAIGIYLAKAKPAKLLNILPVINDRFTIPPNDPNYQVTASLPIGFFGATHLYVIAPHMHLLGRKMNVQAVFPDGSTKCLVNIDDWDFNWQGMYRYKEPIALPAGTRLDMTAYFDNSVDNYRNPNNPPQPVSWGEATTDEMAIAFVGVTFD